MARVGSALAAAALAATAAVLSTDSLRARVLDHARAFSGEAPVTVVTFQEHRTLALLRLLHLVAFATALGTTYWVTFVGGIIMFRNLPRHQFGTLQSKLFPAYIATQAVCACACIAVFAALHPVRDSQEALQLAALGVVAVCSLSNLAVFGPVTSKITQERHKVEREAGIGQEAGLSKNREVAKTNPQLAALNRKFGTWHGLSSTVNMISFGALCVHLWYLACRLLV
eukprot:SM000015S01264  [mRNA]  locus=s15:932774:933947:+ [translate_table: standard]